MSECVREWVGVGCGRREGREEGRRGGKKGRE
jgi:hypothetical protein